MSFLAPLYLLGTLALSLPVLLHLIRRTPRGKQVFSSLMFLSPSPPRITRRSRIEHWLLLLLRAAALALLAFAFARPFVRESANLLLDTGPGKRVAILVDTSASMQRQGLWAQAQRKVHEVLAQLGPGDQVGLFAFDDTTRLIVDWNEPLPDPASRRARIRTGLTMLSPTWGRTDLGRALVTVADRLTTSAAEDKSERSSQIVLISDLQHGAETAALQAYEWPAQVRLQVEQLRPQSADNAHVRLVADETQAGWRVRVANATGSGAEQFRVAWGMPDDETHDASGVDVYVPAGQSRVVPLPAPPRGADRVRLVGDKHAFDNEFFFAPIQQEELHVAYVGVDKPEDPQGLRYFVERVWTETPRRKVRIEERKLDSDADFAPPNRPRLVIVSTALDEAQSERLKQYVRGGGTTLLVANEPQIANSLIQLVPGVRLAETGVSTARAAAYALLGDIDFDHPVFASFVGPRYSDFTKLRIWKHQRFVLEDAAQARVLARFDNGDPALWEQPLETGKVLWMACSWRPSESQLALSSKFVPLLSNLLDHATGREQGAATGWHVHQPIPLPLTQESQPLRMTKPGGTIVAISDPAQPFRGADLPGVYHLQQGPRTIALTVNLDASESDTAPMAADQLEQLGVPLGREATREEQLARQRQMRDMELESRQKLWRWLLLGVLGVLMVETTMAGRLARRAERTEETT